MRCSFRPPCFAHHPFCVCFVGSSHQLLVFVATYLLVCGLSLPTVPTSHHRVCLHLCNHLAGSQVWTCVCPLQPSIWCISPIAGAGAPGGSILWGLNEIVCLLAVLVCLVELDLKRSIFLLHGRGSVCHCLLYEHFDPPTIPLPSAWVWLHLCIQLGLGWPSAGPGMARLDAAPIEWSSSVWW